MDDVGDGGGKGMQKRELWQNAQSLCSGNNIDRFVALV